MANGVNDRAFSAMETAASDKTRVDLFPKEIDKSTKGIHNALMAAGMTPALGNVADLTDAALYALEGEFGDAGWAMGSAIPFLGQMVAGKKALKIAKDSGEEIVTLYRGVPKWFKGSMVKKGKFVGNSPGPPTDMLWATDRLDYAKRIASEEGGVLLEFEVPESYIKKFFKNVTGQDRKGMRTGFFQEGLEKEFLKKVHK